MKKITILLLVVVILVTLVTGCGPTPTPVTIRETVVVEKEVPVKETVVVEKEVVKEVVVTPALEPEGELVIVVGTAWIQNLDPQRGTNGSAFYHDLMYDPLIGVDSQGELDPTTGIAKRWEYSRDYDKLTLWLRDDVVFHNGDPLTAEDVKFSLEEVVSEESLDEYKGHLQHIAEINILDPYKLELILDAPTPRLVYFLTTLQAISGLILPQDYIEEHGREYFGAHPIGSGPYKFHSQMVDSYIKYEAVDYPHWRIGLPKYKYVTFMIVPEEGTRIAMLKRGEANLVVMGRERMKEVEDAGFQVNLKKGGQVYGWAFPELWDENNPFSIKEVREAAALAIDKESIVEYMLQDAATVGGFGPLSGSYMICYPEDLTAPVPFDPEKARELLVQAGFPDGGPEFDLYSYVYGGFPEGPTIVEAIAEMLSEVGFKPNIVVQDYGTVKPKLYEFELGPSMIYLAPSNRLLGEDVPFQLLHSAGVWQITRDPAMDALLDTVSAATTMEDYCEAVHDLMKTIRDEHIILSIAETDVVWGLSPEMETWNMGKAAYDLNLDSVLQR